LEPSKYGKLQDTIKYLLLTLATLNFLPSFQSFLSLFDLKLKEGVFAISSGRARIYTGSLFFFLKVGFNFFKSKKSVFLFI
jgi:hypothetical protein